MGAFWKRITSGGPRFLPPPPPRSVPTDLACSRQIDRSWQEKARVAIPARNFERGRAEAVLKISLGQLEHYATAHFGWQLKSLPVLWREARSAKDLIHGRCTNSTSSYYSLVGGMPTSLWICIATGSHDTAMARFWQRARN